VAFSRHNYISFKNLIFFIPHQGSIIWSPYNTVAAHDFRFSSESSFKVYLSKVPGFVILVSFVPFFSTFLGRYIQLKIHH